MCANTRRVTLGLLAILCAGVFWANAPAWAADPAGFGSSAANRLPAQVAQAASDQPPPPAGEEPPSAVPSAVSMLGMAAGSLTANPNPMSFDAGPLGPVYVTGAVSALGLWQNNKFPGDQHSLASLSNGQFMFQKTEGLFQYFVQAGAYTLPALGTPYVNTPKATGDFYGALPQAFIKLAPTDARGWRNRGMIRLYQGDNKGGLADYDHAVQYDPTDVFSWNNRAQAKMRLGDKPGAIADFRKALELRPDLRIARDSLRQLGAAP